MPLYSISTVKQYDSSLNIIQHYDGSPKSGQRKTFIITSLV